MLNRRLVLPMAASGILAPKLLPAQTVFSASSGSVVPLYRTVASVGNGADLTEDTLQTFTMAAGQLSAVNDCIHIVAGGTLGGTTDSKTIKIKLGAATPLSKVTSTATNTIWLWEAWIIKSSSNNQRIMANLGMQAGTTSLIDTTATQTDTNALAIVVTGQNATSSVAGSVTCDMLSIEYMRAP